MTITVTPEDIIKRCLWKNYKKFCLKGYSSKDVDKIIEENKPFPLSEEDAYVIGLLKVVQTYNLVHRFKQYINEVIEENSTVQKIDNQRKILINRNTLINESLNFKNNFPEIYNQDETFMKKINEVNEYINNKVKEIEELEVIEVQKLVNNKNKVYKFLLSKKASEMFKLNSFEK